MELNQDIINVIIGFSILVGALQCFFGYRIFKFILGLTGFLTGGALAGIIGYSTSQEEVFVLLSGLVGGIIGATLMVALYYVGIFLIGALLGGILGTVFYTIAESNPDPAVLLILAVIAGVLALIIQKFMIIISTGFAGSWVVVIGIAHFTTKVVDLSNLEPMFNSGGRYLYAILLGWLVLGIAGVIFQYRYTSIKKTQPSASPDSEKRSAQFTASKQ